MSIPVFAHLLPLMSLLLWASVTDLRERRIRNWLTVSLMITGLAQSLMPGALATPGQAILGFLCGFGLTFVLFALGALGGGDVKLLAGVGAWIGPGPILGVFILAAIIGMVIVLVQAMWQGRIAILFRNSAMVAINLVHVREVGLDHVTATGKSSRSVDRPLPYAVPVLLAVMILAYKSYLLPA